LKFIAQKTKILGFVGIVAGNAEIQKLLHTEVKEKYAKEKILLKFYLSKRLNSENFKSSLSNQSIENNEEEGV